MYSGGALKKTKGHIALYPNSSYFCNRSIIIVFLIGEVRMILFWSWFLFASIQFAATTSPGPAFLVGIRNAVSYGWYLGIATAFGLGCGILVHIVFVLTGLSLLIEKSNFTYSLVKYSGSAYLIYIGIKCLLSSCATFMAQKSSCSTSVQRYETNSQTKHFWEVFLEGFLTNSLNPKALIFFTAVLSQFVTAETKLSIKFLYGGTSFFIECGWYVLVSLLFMNQNLRAKFLSGAHWIDMIFGGLIIFLGVRLAF